MDFKLSEEQLLIQSSAFDFAQSLRPGVIERDENATFPTQQVAQLSALGFMGMMVEEQYGGSQTDTLSYILAIEEISKIDASVGVIMSAHNSLALYGLQEFGSAYQKTEFLTP